MSHTRFWAAALLFALIAEPFADSAERAFVLDPAATKIGFVLEATLHSVEGRAGLSEGKIEFDLERGAISGMVRVDARSATTGIGMRDTTMHAEVLESERFPEITFVPERLIDFHEEAARVILTVEGRIKIRGAEHPLALPVEIEADGTRVRLRTRFVIPYAAWGMKDVSSFLLRVGKTVEVRIDAVGTLDRPLGGVQ